VRTWGERGAFKHENMKGKNKGVGVRGASTNGVNPFRMDQTNKQKENKKQEEIYDSTVGDIDTIRKGVCGAACCACSQQAVVQIFLSKTKRRTRINME